MLSAERNESMNPRVSIILPTYNGKKYIRESIDSILKQSFTDWEFIVVDDCSTDGTAEILKEYADSCVRIPMIGETRSLNLSNSVAILLYEALRQNQFQHMKLQGELHRLSWDEDSSIQ